MENLMFYQSVAIFVFQISLYTPPIRIGNFKGIKYAISAK